MKVRNSTISFMLLLCSLFCTVSGYAAEQNVDITIYGTGWCKMCNQSKQYFQRKGVTFEYADVEKSDNARQRFQALGGHHVPLIVIGQYRILGFNRAEIDKALRDSGVSKA